MDACQGDSGGPYFDVEKGEATIYGIISRGVGCALPHSPGIYTSVDYFKDWIEEITKDPERHTQAVEQYFSQTWPPPSIDLKSGARNTVACPTGFYPSSSNICVKDPCYKSNCEQLCFRDGSDHRCSCRHGYVKNRFKKHKCVKKSKILILSLLMKSFPFFLFL